MRGRAYVFGDDVNTDYITPSQYFGLPIAEIAEHVFEPLDAEFADRFEEGGVVVAGENFGLGSSRETAPAALKEAGVSVVVAESFARIFYRNAVAIGLPVLVCEGVTDGVSEGDVVDVSFEDCVVRNETTGERFGCESIPPEIRAIFEVGGLLEHLKRYPEGLRAGGVDAEPR